MIIMDSATASLPPVSNNYSSISNPTSYLMQNQLPASQLPHLNNVSNNNLMNNFSNPQLMAYSNNGSQYQYGIYRNGTQLQNPTNMNLIPQHHSQQPGGSSTSTTPNPLSTHVNNPTQSTTPATATPHPPTSTSSINRSQRCGVCRGCQCKPCGTCTYCQDSPQFGGPGVKKQSCIERRCLRVLENRLQRDAPTFKARVGCHNCDDCSMPDCQICLVCLDKRFFNNRYMTGALCAKKRCNNATTLELGNNNNSGNVVDRHNMLKRSYENSNYEQVGTKRRGVDHQSKTSNTGKNKGTQQSKTLQQKSSPGRNTSKSPNNETKAFIENGNFNTNGTPPLQDSNCASGKKFTGFRATNNSLINENCRSNLPPPSLLTEQQQLNYSNAQNLLSIPITSCLNTLNTQIPPSQYVTTSLSNTVPPLQQNVQIGYSNTFPQQQFDMASHLASQQQQQQFLAYQQYQQKFLNYPKYEYYDEQQYTLNNNIGLQHGMVNGYNGGFNAIQPQDPFVPPSYSEMKNAVVLQPL